MSNGPRTDNDIDNTDFLADYHPGPAMEENRDIPRGGPVMRYGRDPRGGRALVRSWTRDIRDDLIPFWQQEIRQLRRLEGLAVAEGLFAPILAAGFDASGFHLVSALDDERRLLVDLTSPAPDEANSEARALQWRNLLRVARALELLHSQGLAHRNFGRTSILSSGGEEPDFQLIGHEWSIRLVSPDSPGAQAPSQAKALAEHFFVRDWRAFGEFAANFATANAERAAVALDRDDSRAARIRVEAQLIHQLRTSMRID